jgi:predicted  nucleic acid-binding Zn-ribbon protein
MNRALLELQELDSALLALVREKNKLDNGDNARAKRDGIAAELATAKEKLAICERTRSQKEDELSATEKKIELQKKRLMNVSSAHEITALERDITGLSNARGDLDEQILTLMDEGETLTEQVGRLGRMLAVAQTQAEEAEANFVSESKRIVAVYTAKKAARPKIEEELSPAEQTKYTTAFKKFGGIAIAKVINGNCSACGTAILPFTLNEAKKQEFPICESCGRLIYID